MKKVFYLLLLMLPLLPFYSCVSKSAADKVTSQKDSLAVVVAQKDSMISDIFTSMGTLAENLDAIKSREGLITTAIDNGEVPKQATTQINEDIEAINQLLISNRQTIARLQNSAKQLKAANVKIAGLENLISQLNLQVEAKNREIDGLRKNLQSLHLEVADLSTMVTGLSTQVTGLSEDKVSLEGEVKTKTDILNTGYYVVGSEKDLLSKEIIYKSGFIGRTLKINENRSLDSFTQVDIRNFDKVVIGEKKATLISSHPAGSYVMSADSKGVFESLQITDPAKFWEYSKVLVISYK